MFIPLEFNRVRYFVFRHKVFSAFSHGVEAAFLLLSHLVVSIRVVCTAVVSTKLRPKRFFLAQRRDEPVQQFVYL